MFVICSMIFDGGKRSDKPFTTNHRRLQQYISTIKKNKQYKCNRFSHWCVAILIYKIENKIS
ncbi:hypothetical protein RD055328_10620 [Companilactobacillus sp. RD055328]|nr:hypothetical protein RD055328_10620 [Companilactobacillus sp. RD055328]